MNVSIGAPLGYHPSEAVIAQAREIASTTGATLEVTHDPAAAVAGANVVITDTWASMGQEAEHAERTSVFAPFCVDEALMAHAADDAAFMHCLPAHRGEEVVDAVMDAPSSLVFDEAENRLHAQKALLSLLLG
jgi:ornithine carbamoyltransferase